MNSTGLSAKIFAYIKERESGKTEKKAKTKISDKSEDSFKKESHATQERFKPINWIADAAKRAWQMQGVTHVLKFTHTSAKGSSLYASQEKKTPPAIPDGGVISTAFLSNLDPDFVGNAAALDVVNFLLIQDEGKSLIDFIREGDMSPFAPFAESEIQLDEWREGFMKIWTSKDLASHTFSKQVYFPVGNGQYHLLSPLHASSFAHEVYKQVQKSLFSDQAKLAQQAKKENKYSSTRVVKYPNIAIQAYGGDKSQNVSHLNKVRGGKISLFSCAPPLWKRQFGPPLAITTIFSPRQFGSRVYRIIKDLQEYLRNKKSVKSVRDYRKECIDSIIDQLILYGAEIRNLQDASGWSALPTCKLSPAEKLWLDPLRANNDEVFAREIEKGDWIEQIAKQFAHWLNRRLSTKELHFGDVECREWRDLLERELRLHKNYLEVIS